MTLLNELAALVQDDAGNDLDEDIRPALLTDLAAAVGIKDEPYQRIGTVIQPDTPSCEAFRIACLMHTRAQDDFYSAGRMHVGATVIPAALAIESPNLLKSLSAGFRIAKVLSHVYSSEAQSRGYRPTGMFGPIAAAAAAAVGLALSGEEFASALAIAAARSAGTNQSWIEGTDEWLLEVGAAARSGVEAAIFAANGIIGAPSAIEGDAGWARALFDDEGAQRLRNFVNSGANLPEPHCVAIKPYPVSGIAQVPVAIMIELRNRMNAVPPKRIVVQVSERALSYPGSRNHGPFRSRSDSLMSISRCCALAYEHGFIRVHDLNSGPSDRERKILDTIDLVSNPELEEDEAQVLMQTDTATERQRRHPRDVLYPSLQELVGDIPNLARRSEANVEQVARFANLVSSTSISAQQVKKELLGLGQFRACGSV